MFITSSAFCSNVEKYLKKRYSLILVYRIGSLGKVQFVLAPTETDEANNDEEDIEDEFDDTDDVEENKEEEELEVEET